MRLLCFPERIDLVDSKFELATDDHLLDVTDQQVLVPQPMQPDPICASCP